MTKKEIIESVAKAICAFIVMDMFLLLFAIAQIASGQPTGQWNSFWFWQVEMFVRFINFIH